MNIAIIGAGVVGLTNALACLERGARVTIYERSSAIGEHSCSRYAGGMIAPWCERENAEELILTLGQEALSYWPKHTSTYTQQGTLVVAAMRDEPDLVRFSRRTRGFETVNAEQIASLEPDLAGRFRQGLFFPDEANIDPRITLAELGREVIKLGGIIHYGFEGDALNSEADHTIDCRGLSAMDQLSDLRGVKGEMLIVRCPDVNLSRPVRLLHPRFPLYIVPREDHHFMIGATVIESGDRDHISVRSIMELLNTAYALHPAFAEAHIIEIGTDARPAFPDHLPRIVHRDKRTFVNGLYRHGFLISPALARMTAQAIFD
jgi:glycine oxidase